MIPYNPLALNGMIRGPEAPNPAALIEASNMTPQTAPDTDQVSSGSQVSSRAEPDIQQKYLALGLAGNMSDDQITAIQDALAAQLAEDQQRAEKLQEARSKAPALPAGNPTPGAAQPGMTPSIAAPTSGSSFTHGHN